MGRLFWKFFLFIWLGQMIAVLGTGAIFWVERQQFAERRGPEINAMRPPGEGHMPPPPDHGKPPPDGSVHFPLMPLGAGLFASLLCAFFLAGYFAKPIRHLRKAFDAASEGDLEQRIAPGMGTRRDELADLGQGFDRMAERLKALMSGQKRLLHDVSHEMRSPLARLQAAIGLARQQPERVEDCLARIEREGERMNVLVGELLTLSRLEAGVIGEEENVDLGELLDDIVDDARFEGAARQVIVNYKPGVMVVLRANPELLHRAIENIVRNALRYSSPGDALTIEAGRVGDGKFRVTVADQGPGVPESELEAIFSPFYRGEKQTGISGYGLGLAIAQRVVVGLGGRIDARPGKPSGLIIFLELPA